MNWLEFPPLNSLRAFSAVAGTGSYTQAAAQLNVTHAAVSQQVRALEERLSTRLVERKGRGIQLTPAGEQLASDLHTGFNIMGQGIERLLEDNKNQPVQITTTPAFAVEWLMPKISEFQLDHPGITLLFNPTSSLVEPEPGGIDIAIRYRDRRRPDDIVTPVLVTDMVVIGTPDLTDGKNLDDPANLVDLPWLQELGTNEALDWLRYRGVVPDTPLTINHMPGNLIMDAVRRGEGITYTARAFFEKDLETGRVVELFSEPAFGLYFLETTPAPLRPDVKTFIDWLLSKAETVEA